MKNNFIEILTLIICRKIRCETGRPTLVCIVFLIALVTCGFTGPAGAEESHSEMPPAFGFDMTEGWSDPPVHSHFSRLGTPMIHSFRTEPAFTRRDLLLDYETRSETGRNEQEITAEVESPITRRLGLIFEIPYVFVDADTGGPIDSFGNLAVSPRLLLADYDRFLLAFGLEIETTTGDTDAGIAEDEVALGPSLSTWLDLGNWWALNTQSGFEYPVESTDAEFFFRSSLIHTFGADEIVDHDHSEHDHHGKHLSGLVSLILEADLALGLSGPEDGDWTAEGIVGMLAGLWDNADIRVGYQFPLSRSQDLNNGVAAGLIWHFK